MPPPPVARQPTPGPLARGLQWAATLAGLPLVLLAFVLLLGLGVLRQGTPVLVSGTAALAVLLPVLGLGSLVRNRATGRALALPLVGAFFVSAFEVYVPGERASALAAGLGTVLAGAGLPPAPALAEQLDAVLPTLPTGRAPVPAAQPVEAAAPSADAGPTSAPDPGPGSLDTGTRDHVVLPYEGQGRSLRIPVAVEAEETLEVSMIFDTGATFSTLDPATLTRLGVRIPSDAPTLRVQTAGGERETALVLLDRIWVGGFSVDGVTVGVCEPCADRQSVGLLGLNVSRNFLVTVDQARQELVMTPRPEARSDDTANVQPWVELVATATRYPDGRVEVETELFNDAPRGLAAAEVTVDCGDTWAVEVGTVEAGGSRLATASLPLGQTCTQGYAVRLTHAEWAAR